MNKVCTYCVMDSTVPNINFDNKGRCNYCLDFEQSITSQNSILYSDKSEIEEMVASIKERNKHNDYDCIVGLSGGVDSSWVLYLAKKMGLRPLAVHMDNGWNSELAQSNIEGLVRTLGVPLHTHVIDWNEYRNLMNAFFDSDVVDVELLYDNAMLAVNYQTASNFGVKDILGGTNISTEGMRMPSGWNWFKYDARNIRSIASKHGINKFNSYPLISSSSYFINNYIKGIKWVSFLDYFDYKKDNSLNILERECGYRRYPYKHYESIFTRFYQGYILPHKFGIDKRKVHLSTLIVSNQLSRNEALIKLSEIPYPSINDLESDIQYFLKKMRWNQTQLDDYISRPMKPHDYYSNEFKVLYKFRKIYKILQRASRSSW